MTGHLTSSTAEENPDAKTHKISRKTAKKATPAVQPKHMNPAKSRLEVRITPQDKDLIEQAAFVSRETTTTFVLQAARSAAQEVLRREQVTVVPPDFYDDILASLDAEPMRNTALTEAARKNSDIMNR
ncbi:DUF1778 domain-containing protein [Sphaerisporangium sp. NPDC051011]|uniref:type II toxin-antitoxin system TacA family antitoxin n=1 Tax=Sphaerisporangium sp. NPDC051011 TaxID=3155792 RepID=UPI003409F681